VKSRAKFAEVGGEQLLVAALSDIAASQRAANRPRDRAVLDVLTTTLKERPNLALATRSAACSRSRMVNEPTFSVKRVAFRGSCL